VFYARRELAGSLSRSDLTAFGGELKMASAERIE
jgi:hypothetical protein